MFVVFIYLYVHRYIHYVHFYVLRHHCRLAQFSAARLSNTTLVIHTYIYLRRYLTHYHDDTPRQARSVCEHTPPPPPQTQKRILVALSTLYPEYNSHAFWFIDFPVSAYIHITIYMRRQLSRRLIKLAYENEIQNTRRRGTIHI